MLKFVLKRTCSLRISCSQWRFSLSPIYERKTWKNLNIEIQNFISIFVLRSSIFAPLAFLCSNLYYSERAHCEYHVSSEGSHFHPSTKEKLGKI